MRPTLTKAIALAVAIAATTAACGSDDKPKESTATTLSVRATVNAQVASYDLSAGTPQRFIVGLVTNDNGLLVGGQIGVAFRRVAAGAKPTARFAANFLTVADSPAIADGPRLRDADESVGVYALDNAVFKEPGNWEVEVVGKLDNKDFVTRAAFKVSASPEIPAPGDAAPRTENLLPGAKDAPAKAVDSRAEDDGTVPDPALHEVTVASAIAQGKPTIVVVSTPVYCVSQFCGPITDAVDTIAGEFAGKASFVHIEVWRDFEKKELNRHAAEWMYPAGSEDAREPWVFLIDKDGNIAKRWDNVANGADIRNALKQLVG